MRENLDTDSPKVDLGRGLEIRLELSQDLDPDPHDWSLEGWHVSAVVPDLDFDAVCCREAEDEPHVCEPALRIDEHGVAFKTLTEVTVFRCQLGNPALAGHLDDEAAYFEWVAAEMLGDGGWLRNDVPLLRRSDATSLLIVHSITPGEGRAEDVLGRLIANEAVTRLARSDDMAVFVASPECSDEGDLVRPIMRRMQAAWEEAGWTSLAENLLIADLSREDTWAGFKRLRAEFGLGPQRDGGWRG